MIYNGIDVSKHNGVIDWPRVRAAVRFSKTCFWTRRRGSIIARTS